MARRNTNQYKSTFEVSSYSRPVTQRLTPLAKICIGIAVFFVLAIGFVVITKLSGTTPEQLRAQFDKAAATPVAQQPAGAVAAVAAEKSVPPTQPVVQRAGAGATATTAINKPRTATPVPLTTSTPRARASDATPLPQPAAGVDNGASVEPGSANWADQMARSENGEWMAPEDQVKRTEADVQAYFTALNTQQSPKEAYRDMVENSDAFFARFFDGDALRTVKAAQNKEQLTVLRSGTTNVRVVRYTKDGSIATVAISKRSWIIDAYDRATLENPTELRPGDEDLLWMVRYSPIDRRWKIMNTTSLPSGRRVFSEEGKRSFDAFVKEIEKSFTPTPAPAP